MNRTYDKTLSPFQPQMGVVDVSNENHPAREEVKRLCNVKYNIEVSFEEDTATLNHFRHIPGLVAILCTMKQNGQVFAFGRSCSVFSKLNKYLEKTISTAINGSFLSAANTATKIFEALRSQELEPASDKQKNYLKELIKTKVSDGNRRNQLSLKIDEIDKDQASELIKRLLLNQT